MSTHFERRDLRVLAELWRADVTGEHPDWQVAADAAGVDRNTVPSILVRLQDDGHITGIEPGSYVPFPMAARVKRAGREAIGEWPAGIEAALTVMRVTIEHAEQADAERASTARHIYDAAASGPPTLDALTEAAEKIANALGHAPR